MENGRVSQKISLKPKLSERRPIIQASRSPVPSPIVGPPETPKTKDGIIYGIFGDRSLLFLGVIASILALSMALWSIHKNSDITRRLNSLNSTVVDLVVKQKAAPVVEVGRRDVDPKTSKFAKFKEEREAKKREKVAVNDPLKATVEEINIYNREQERERTAMLERIRRESDENIRRMELASQEALAEGKRHTVSTKQLSERVNRLHVKTPSSTDVPYANAAEKIFGGISQLGEQFAKTGTPKQVFVDDIDVDDLEKDLRLLTGR